MDEIKNLKKIKKYLKTERFSQKKSFYFKYHENKEGRKISEKIKKNL